MSVEVNGRVLASLRSPAAARSGGIAPRAAAGRGGPAMGLVTVVVALAQAALVLIGAGPAAAADETVGIAAAPASDGRPDGRTRFSLLTSAGQQVQDTLLVRNTGSTDAELRVYAADAATGADGAFALDEANAPGADVAGWVAFGAGAAPTLRLASGAQALVPFTVTVPAGAPAGDHVGGIVVSTGPVDGVERRVATRLYVRVQGVVQPGLAVTSVSASQPGGTNPLAGPTTITAVLANTGGVALAARLTAGVRTVFGITTGTVADEDVAELLPGETRTVTLDLGSVARAGYLAPYVELVPVADEAYPFAASLPTVRGQGALVAVPWLPLGLVVLAAGGARLLVVRRRAGGAAVASAAPVPTADAP